MFDDQPKPAQATPVEDIFAPADAGAVPPVHVVPPAVAPATGAAPLPRSTVLPTNAELMMGSGEGSSRKVLLAVVGGVVVLALGGGAWWWFTMRTPAPATPVTTNQPVAPADQTPQPTAPTPTTPVATPQPVDSDGDGLSDAQEQQLGTNPLDPDTDHDGLFDGEEVNVYHTNPLDPDSDHDGYSDGQEVHNGYNPLGPGKLLELPAQP